MTQVVQAEDGMMEKVEEDAKKEEETKNEEEEEAKKEEEKEVKNEVEDEAKIGEQEGLEHGQLLTPPPKPPILGKGKNIFSEHITE